MYLYDKLKFLPSTAKLSKVYPPLLPKIYSKAQVLHKACGKSEPKLCWQLPPFDKSFWISDNKQRMVTFVLSPYSTLITQIS